ncbi:MAG TPA: DUF1987 domain-containing protein [Salinivirgaceae bacterium]|nr:DUF1987 domain-containing protein [Salinivirgaceae bacterium]
MNNYLAESTHSSPKIQLDAQQGTLLIVGRSIPENAMKVYRPVMEWIEQYSVKPKKQTTITIQLSFFNTSTSKYLMELLKRFEDVCKQGFDVIVNWHCDDEDILDIVQDYKALVKVPVNIIANIPKD